MLPSQYTGIAGDKITATRIPPRQLQVRRATLQVHGGSRPHEEQHHLTPPSERLRPPGSRECLPPSAGQLEDLDGLEPSAVPIEARQDRERAPTCRVQQGVALRRRELGAQQRDRLQAVGDAERLADGAPNPPVTHPPNLKNHPALTSEATSEHRQKRKPTHLLLVLQSSSCHIFNRSQNPGVTSTINRAKEIRVCLCV